MHLEPSDLAPDFTLPVAGGGEVVLARMLSEAASGVIVYFYPRAASPGCTTEACDFRDNLGGLRSLGYSVLGVSPDPLSDLAAFAAAEHLPFALASDIDHQVADAYGAWGPIDGRAVDGLHRSTVVIDPSGRVQRAMYDVAATGHVAALRAELER